jgi:hypothetical protein
MLEKISKWTERKFAPGSSPDAKTVIGWIKAGRFYGEQIGGRWYIDETVSPVHSPSLPKPTIDTGNPIADNILSRIKHA